MQTRTKALLIGLTLVFSQTAFCGEMIRYEHDVYSGGSAEREYKPSEGEEYTVYQKKQGKVIRQKKEKMSHPIFTAFPDHD